MPRRDPATVVFYAQDSRGLGHINRTLAVAQRMVAANEHVNAVLVTDSRMPDVFSWPPRCDFLKLPRVPWKGVGQPAALKRATRERLGSLGERYGRLRREMLIDVVRELAPDLVVVDYSPFGAGREFRDALNVLKSEHPASRLVYLMQDVQDDSDYVKEIWRKGVYAAFDALFDDIVVCGARQLWDVADLYGLPRSVHGKLRYCGYIVREPVEQNEGLRPRYFTASGTGPLVVVTVGGGSVGYPLLDATLAALNELRMEHPDLESVLVTGPLMSDEQHRLIEQRASAADHVLRRADNFQLMAEADAAVIMAGYNSVAEALALSLPCVVSPQPPKDKERYGKEQLLRAERLAALGLAQCVPMAKITPNEIAAGLRWALACDRAAYGERIRAHGFTFEGALRLAQYAGAWLAGNDSLGLSIYRHGSRDEPKVALTFDDGPNPPRTDEVLDILANAGVRATFFLLGKWVIAHADAVERIVRAGHGIGNHSFTHRRGRCDFDQAETAIAGITGRESRFVRAPEFDYAGLVQWVPAYESGMRVIGAEVDSRDYASRSAETILANVLDNRDLQPGSIIVLHDGSESDSPRERLSRPRPMIEALPRIIDGLRARGLEPEGLNEMTLMGAHTWVAT